MSLFLSFYIYALIFWKAFIQMQKMEQTPPGGGFTERKTNSGASPAAWPEGLQARGNINRQSIGNPILYIYIYVSCNMYYNMDNLTYSSGLSYFANKSGALSWAWIVVWGICRCRQTMCLLRTRLYEIWISLILRHVIVCWIYYTQVLCAMCAKQN